MQRFARVDPHEVPKKSALHAGIKAIDAEAWRSIDGVLLQDAKLRGFESGRQVRIDSTATDTDILTPSDSRLLYDGVRVLTRLLRQARRHLAGVSFRDHCRAAKRREQEIRSGSGARQRAATYRRLLRLVAQTVAYAAARARACCVTDPWAESWCVEVGAYRELVARVIDQTKRRVFDGETVPASQKVVSLFEPHTDIIGKGGRATEYGHKINLSTGRSGLVLDVVVEADPNRATTRPLVIFSSRDYADSEPERRQTDDMLAASTGAARRASTVGHPTSQAQARTSGTGAGGARRRRRATDNPRRSSVRRFGAEAPRRRPVPGLRPRAATPSPFKARYVSLG